MLISTSFWMQGRRDPATEHADRALALLADARPSQSVAWVLLRHASLALLKGQHERALELCLHTRGLAEQLGWEHGVSEALGMLGLTRVQMGSPRGLDDVEQGIDVAAGAGARLEGARVAERIGSPGWIRWFESVLIDHRYRRGEWNEALREADEFIAEIEAGSPHYNSFQLYAVRAEMRLARGDPAGAIRDAESALATGRAVEDPQAVFFVLPACAHVFSLASERGRAVPLAREFLEALSRGVGMQFAVINLPTFASAALQLDLARELLGALADHPQTPWTETVRAYAQGDFAPPPRSCTESAQSRRRRKPDSERRSSSWPRAAARRRTSSCSRLSSSTARWAPRTTCASARLCSPLPPSEECLVEKGRDFRTAYLRGDHLLVEVGLRQ